MAFGNVEVIIDIHGDPSAGIFEFTDRLELKWDLDEYPDERERIRVILQEAWAELYDDGGIDVRFGDECPDCQGVGYHKPSCPLDQVDIELT